MSEVTPSTRSRWIVLFGAVLAVLVLGAGFWFASQFQSSAQQEADATAPTAGPVFAEVSMGTLAAEVGFTGDVGPSAQYPISVVPAADASRSVVTGRPLETGSTASSGYALTEVNGRPLFGVQSPFPFYRDMGVGDRGPDVEALQKALVTRSYLTAADGRFGSATAQAVTRWYQDGGYTAPARTAVEPKSPDPSDPSSDAAATPASEVYVPIAELVAMPSDSAQVIQGLQTGQQLGIEGAADFVLGSADVVVTVTTPVVSLGDVVAGDAATISIGGEDVGGVVGEIRSTGSDASSDDAAETEQGATEVTFVVTPNTALPALSGRATVAVTKEIVAQDALLVPVLAVSDRGPDKNVLTKRADDGSLVEVRVTVLGTLQGEVAVAPTKQGALEVGDQVRVG